MEIQGICHDGCESTIQNGYGLGKPARPSISQGLYDDSGNFASTNGHCFKWGLGTSEGASIKWNVQNRVPIEVMGRVRLLLGKGGSVQVHGTENNFLVIIICACHPIDVKTYISAIVPSLFCDKAQSITMCFLEIGIIIIIGFYRFQRNPDHVRIGTAGEYVKIGSILNMVAGSGKFAV